MNHPKPIPQDPIVLARHRLAGEAGVALKDMADRIKQNADGPARLTEIFMVAGMEGPLVDDLLQEFQALKGTQ